MTKYKYPFRWTVFARMMKAIGDRRNARRVLLDLIDTGVVKQTGRGVYRFTGKRNATRRRNVV